MKSSERAQIRKRSGLTQIRLAKLAGISQARLSSWENHEIELSPEDIMSVARVLEDYLRQPMSFDGATGLARALGLCNGR
jgi:transcriptional regulator with XRE-family HTH domain